MHCFFLRLGLGLQEYDSAQYHRLFMVHFSRYPGYYKSCRYRNSPYLKCSLHIYSNPRSDRTATYDNAANIHPQCIQPILNATHLDIQSSRNPIHRPGLNLPSLNGTTTMLPTLQIRNIASLLILLLPCLLWVWAAAIGED